MALTVENGSGLPNADSYLSVADADAYHAAQGGTGWTGTTDQKESALRQATEYLDNRYGLRWNGRRINETMALDWPRTGVVDRDGWTVSDSAVPSGVERATAYVALKVREGTELVPDVLPGTNATAESVQVGAIRIETSYAGLNATAPSFPTVDMLLRDLIQSAGTVSRA